MKKQILFALLLAFTILSVTPRGFCQSIGTIIAHEGNQSNEATGLNSPNRSDSKQSGTIQNKDMDTDKPKSNLKPSVTDSGYALQTGTFILENDANRQVIELKEKGFAPYIFQSVNSKNQTLFAVRIGNYKTYEEAKNSLHEIEPSMETPVFIVRYDSLEPIVQSEINAASTDQQPNDGETSIPSEKSSAVTAPSVANNSDKDINQRLQDLEEEIRRLKDEADIRKKLQATESETSSTSEDDILDAAGREYTLTREGNLKFSYNISYAYSNYDAIRASASVEEVANHSISNSFSVSYGLKDNFNMSTSIPFVYKYTHTGTVDTKSATGIGDLSLSWSWQPVKPSSAIPTVIINGSFKIPSGRSPYEINTDKDLSTGSGIYSTGLGFSLSRVTDPVVVFSSFSVSYPFSVTNINQKRGDLILDKVDPGMGLGFGCGMGYSLSYKLYLNMSFSYSYSFETEYFYKDQTPAKSGTGTSANLGFGVGYKYSPRQNLNFSLGIPITDNNGFSFSFSTPIEFEM